MSAVGSRSDTALPAVVLIAHDKPDHLRRLVAALDPLPIFLHVDANTPDDVFHAMTDDLPTRVSLLPRLAAGWARYEVLAAELLGYRTALAQTEARHVILCTGADYPVASVERICAVLAAAPDRSYAEIQPLPIDDWGPLKGWDRFVFRQRPWKRRRLAWPVPRRLPAGLTAAGGAQTKILTRRHAALVLAVLDADPALLRFFRRCWTPDEVAIPSILSTEHFGARWSTEGSSQPHPWFIDWGPVATKNPRWLGPADLPAITAATRTDPPALFARKLGGTGTGGDLLADAIDTELRTVGAPR